MINSSLLVNSIFPTKAVRHPIPEPMPNDPKNTIKKLPNDFNMRPRSKLSCIAPATYFSIELNRREKQTLGIDSLQIPIAITLQEQCKPHRLKYFRQR